MLVLFYYKFGQNLKLFDSPKTRIALFFWWRAYTFYWSASH